MSGLITCTVMYLSAVAPAIRLNYYVPYTYYPLPRLSYGGGMGYIRRT